MNKTYAWAWFFAWCAVGVGLVGGLLAAFALPVTVVLWLMSGGGAVAIARHKEGRLAWPGVLTGFSILAFLVAYLDRDGPGEVCTAQIARVCSSAEERWSPWPFVAIGVIMASAGVLGFIFMHGRAGKRPG